MDLPVNINGLALTLKDASTWVNPGIGYVIDLTTQEGRALLRAERDELITHRAALRAARDIEIGIRDEAIGNRDDFVVDINIDTARITLIRDFLTTVGDDPDA